MNRDPQAWARLGRALKNARERQGTTQEDLARQAGVSSRTVHEAEGGKVPKSRMPYTLAPIARALGWPAGSVEAVLGGAEPPGGWTDIPVHVDPETVTAIIGNAMLRAADNVTAAEIRRATQIAVEELRRAGIIPQSDEASPTSEGADL